MADKGKEGKGTGPPWRLTEVGTAHHQGPRPTDEDAWFVVKGPGERPGEVLLGVLDGHGGAEAARLAALWLPRALQERLAPLHPADGGDVAPAFTLAFQEVSRNIKRVTASGTTAVVAWLAPPHLWHAHAGDSRIVLARNGEAVALTRDHRLDHPGERERLAALGARFYGPYLVAPDGSGLMVTRALGDAPFEGLVLDTPEVGHTLLGPGDRALILACDGLWDVCPPSRAVALALKAPTAQGSAQALVETALAYGTTDNVTVVVARPRNTPA